MAVSGGGGGGTGGAIRAGRAFVEMSVDDSGVKPALARVKRMVLGVAAGIAAAGAGAIGLGAALFGPIFGLFKETVDHITEVRKAAGQLGTTPEAFSALGYAAQKAGVDTETLVAGGRHLQRVLSEAAGGSKTAQAELEKLGLSAKDLIDLPLDQQFGAIADAIAALPNPADQAAAAFKLLGRGGVSLLPVLRQGSAGLKAMAGEAKEFGLIVTGEEAAKAKQWTTAVGNLSRAFSGLKLAIGGALLEIAGPAQEYSQIIVNVLKQARQWIGENQQLVLGIAAVGAALIIAGGTLVAVAGGITALVFVVGALGTAAGIVGSVLAAVFSPVGLGIAVIAAASIAIVQLLDDLGAFEGMAGTLKWVWGGVLATLTTTFQGIKDALSVGDLKLAWQVGLAGLNVLWKGFLVGLQAGWNEFKAVFVDGWHTMILGLKLVVNDFLAGFEATINEALDALPARVRKTIGLEGKVSLGVRPEADIRADFEREQAERMKARADDLAGVTAALVEAKKNLEALGEAARTARNTKLAGEFAMSGILAVLGRANLGRVAAATTELAGVRGQFGGGALGSALAVGDASIPKKQLEELEGINDKLGDIQGKVGGLAVE